jgi:NAD(P)H dehydrogenase (quinone)
MGCQMHVLLVYCHPRTDSFCSALRDTATSALRAANHTVEVRDLYAEGFVPTMSADERGRYYGDSLNLHGIEEHISALQRADALLLVYPTWWFSLPAMLKGWFDRVWVPGVAFRLRRAGGLEPLLMSIRRLGVVTTYGSPRWLLWFIGWPDRRMVNSAFRSLCARGCRLDWIALTSMDTCTAKQREQFLGRVNSRLSRWR